MQDLREIRSICLLLVTCGAALSIQGCFSGGPPPKGRFASQDRLEKEELLQRLESLELTKELWSLVVDDRNAPFFELPFVRELYCHPEIHADAARVVLLDPEVSTALKVHAIHLLQCRELDQYINLGREVLEAFKKGNVESVVLEAIVDPSPDWGTRIALAYTEPVVAEFLEDVLATECLTPETRQIYLETADGTRAEFLDYYCAGGRECPKLRCM